ncbi:MAG TPA: MmgE/PrpD family protein [Stellaceae bacterium]|nr:MmgE/PrpD family protein [Stellaceae bacterium]
MSQFGLTAYVADFIHKTRYDDVPAEVARLGKASILDALGCALAGAHTPTVDILRRYVQPFEGVTGPTASVLGGGAKLPPRFAALINGTAMHVDDYDDTQQAATGKFQGIHPTAAVLSALLAAGESCGASGIDVLLAYQIGAELACKLFDATHPNHILNGYHSTGTCGLLSAAAAVAKLYRLPPDAIRNCLGIAASQAAGLSENFGTMMKPFHAGRSGETGIVAADLTRMGFTAAASILESPRGFFQAEGGGWEPERIVDRLGQPWAFVDRGIWLKPWPTGSLSHPAMTLMLSLVETHDIKPQDIARITIKTSENISRTLLHHRPQTELEAKFSLEFCVAALAVDRKLGLKSFTDEFVRRPDVQDLIGRVQYDTFGEAEGRAAGHTIVTSFVDLALKDGRQVGGKLDYGKGSKTNPMTQAEIEDKFRDCAGFAGWPADKTERAIATVNRLEREADVRTLLACLT